MKKYIIPEIFFENIENEYLLSCSSTSHDTDVTPSSGGGCTCGCVTRDNPVNNFGCWGCPHCIGGPHSGNHACEF